MLKVLVVFGTRPEAIKMFPLIKLMSDDIDIDLKICVTGQQREMLDQVLELFDISPDFDLNVMSENQNLHVLSSKILLGVSNVIDSFNPDWVFVHGDTTTSTISSLASYYARVPIAHVEAGLRTNNLLSPFPEEGNRQINSRISTLHFCPTELSKQNLLKENIQNVYVTGNTVIDALLYVDKTFLPDFDTSLSEYIVSERKFILITGHRRESFGQGFENICESLIIISKANPDIDIVYPVHFNPNVKKVVYKKLSNFKNIFLIPPQEYLPFIYLMKNCYFILTDSGGIQEEAPAFGKPVLVMRDTTERTEAIDAGTAKLVGTSISSIVSGCSNLLNSKYSYGQMSKAHNPFGQGDSSEKILLAFKQFYSK